jgi:ribosomal protein L12E/L44/L45/RPP1/RPP2
MAGSTFVYNPLQFSDILCDLHSELKSLSASKVADAPVGPVKEIKEAKEPKETKEHKEEKEKRGIFSVFKDKPLKI